MIDTYVRRQTLGVVPFTIFERSEALSIASSRRSPWFRRIRPSRWWWPRAPQGAECGRYARRADDRCLHPGGDVGHKLRDQNRQHLRWHCHTDGAAHHHATDWCSLTAGPGTLRRRRGRHLLHRHAIIVTAAGFDTIAGWPNQITARPFAEFAFHSNGTNLRTG